MPTLNSDALEAVARHLDDGVAGVCCERRGGLRKMLKERSKKGPLPEGAHRDLMSDRGHGQTGGATALTRASSCTRMTSLGHATSLHGMLLA